MILKQMYLNVMKDYFGKIQELLGLIELFEMFEHLVIFGIHFSFF